MTELLSDQMIDSALETEFTRKAFLKGGGALVVGFSLAGSLLAGTAKGATRSHRGRAARRGQHRLLGRAARGQHRDDLLREDQHHRLQHGPPADRRRGARHVDGAGPGDRRRHGVLAEPGHHGRLERHLERRPAGAPGGGGGACRAPRARRQAARRPGVAARGQQGRRVGQGRCVEVGHVRSPAGRQALLGAEHRQGPAEGGGGLQGRRQAR